MPVYSQKDIARFWSKVKKTSTCWIWTASKSKDGYGYFRVFGQNIYAHRFAFILSGGRLIDLALHKCDNPSCVRPSHLFNGTQKHNVRDAMRKNRRHHANLTSQRVKRIKELRAAGMRYAAIGLKLGCCRTTVSLVVRGKLGAS